MERLCKKNYYFFINNSIGVIEQWINETGELCDILNSDFMISLFSIPSFIILVGIIWVYEREWFFLVLIFTFTSIIIIIKLDRYITNNMGIIYNKRANINEKQHEIISGMLELRNSNSIDAFLDRYYDLFKTSMNSEMAIGNKLFLYYQLSFLNSSLQFIMIILFYRIKVKLGILASGNLIFMILIFQKLINDILMINNIYNKWAPLSIINKRIAEHFGNQNDEEIFNNEIPDIRSNSLKVREITFCYPKTKRKILNKLSIYAEKGDLIKITGDNGKGKSTIFRIISGEIRDYTGTIYIDDINISNINFGYCAYMYQNSYIFNMTLKDNIIMNNTYNELKYQRIINKLNFYYYFSNNMIEKSEVIKQNGLNLSSGQKKLIGFARILYADKKIILLDECLANIDRKLRRYIMDIILELKNTHIILMIEHNNEFDDLYTKIINLNYL